MSLRKHKHHTHIYEPLHNYDTLMAHLINPALYQQHKGLLSPTTDVRETRKHYLIQCELPGVKKEDINVSLQNGILKIEASHKEEIEEKEDEEYIRRERHFGQFLRQFDMGGNVTDENIDARFEDGLLTIIIPKANHQPPQTPNIEIK